MSTTILAPIVLTILGIIFGIILAIAIVAILGSGL